MKQTQSDTERVPVLKINEAGSSRVEEQVAREYMLTIFLNDKELVTILCSPRHIDRLAAGFLYSEGLIANRDDILKMDVDEWMGVVRVEAKTVQEDSRFFSKRLLASGCGGSATFYNVSDAALTKIESDAHISPAEVFDLVSRFQHGSELYLATHGVHSAALCDNKSIAVFDEDIGRHNAIDKIFGKCLLEDIPVKDKMIITSGRVSSEIMHKIAKRNIPIIISVSAPTNLGIKIADKLGITLIGLVRGGKMNVYTHDGRVN
jgi:FdhD protein